MLFNHGTHIHTYMVGSLSGGETQSRSCPIGVGKIAWSYNNWRGIDEETSGKWRKEKCESHEFVCETGFAYEWWNFYEGFDNDYYYGHIEWVNQSPPEDFKNGLILFISKKPKGRMYFIGFYGGADISSTSYDTGKRK
jgi:hypothetical protein